MAISKNGYLFCAAEKEDHKLYAIIKKEDKKEPVYTHSQMQNNVIVEFEPSIENSDLKVSDTI